MLYENVTVSKNWHHFLYVHSKQHIMTIPLFQSAFLVSGSDPALLEDATASSGTKARLSLPAVVVDLPGIWKEMKKESQILEYNHSYYTNSKV